MLRELKKKKGEDGFASMVEVMVTSVIFVLAAAGILSTVSMLRPHGTETSKRIEAAYVGKGVIDQLRREVDAEMWNDSTSNLALGIHVLPSIGDYTVNYTITADAATPNLRKLTMNITWP